VEKIENRKPYLCYNNFGDSLRFKNVNSCVFLVFYKKTTPFLKKTGVNYFFFAEN
jgi:hypothetical protein